METTNSVHQGAVLTTETVTRKVVWKECDMNVNVSVQTAQKATCQAPHWLLFISIWSILTPSICQAGTFVRYETFCPVCTTSKVYCRLDFTVLAGTVQGSFLAKMVMVTFTVRGEGMHYGQWEALVCVRCVSGCLSTFLTASALTVSRFHLDWPIHLRDKQRGRQMVNINKCLLDREWLNIL